MGKVGTGKLSGRQIFRYAFIGRQAGIIVTIDTTGSHASVIVADESLSKKSGFDFFLSMLENSLRPLRLCGL